MARRGYHRHRLSQRVLPHIRDVPRLLSFAGALAGVGLAAAPAPSPALLLTVTLAAEGKSAEGEAELARIKPRMEKFPRSEEHTSELQSLRHLVCRLLLEKK